MALCVIELNDCDIRVARDTEIIVHNPGYAVLSNDQLHLGEAALKLAYLNPRETYNRFWSKLSQDALQTPTKQYRHNADLAHAHLMAIYELAGKPEEIIFAVPGSYSNEQLSLLLGIAAACPFTPVGLVDSAVASTAAIADTGVYVHLDIHLHHTVLTHINVNEQVERISVEVINETGLNTVYSACANLVADLFIQQSRFDPLHHAITEQTLYDKIPTFLRTLKDNSEILVDIQHKEMTHQVKLQRDVLLNTLQAQYEKITQRLPEGVSCLLSDHIATLPGFAEMLTRPEVLNYDTVFQGCQQHRQKIYSSGSALDFITKLPTTTRPSISTTTQIVGPTKSGVMLTSPVSHVLYQYHAYPLSNSPLYLLPTGGIVKTDDDRSGCSIVLNSQGATLYTETTTARLNGKTLSNVEKVQTGDSVGFTGSDAKYTFISAVEQKEP